MKFYMPVRVYDEPDCISRHTEELCALGNKALIVTGRHSAVACGALEDVLNALKAHGKQSCLFSEVEENPSIETIMKAAVFGKKEQADFVIGIGGGSPLDAAKAIAFLLNRDRFLPEDLYDSSLPSAAFPLAAVPTTCGTGSEVTGVSVLTVHEKKTKMSIPHRIFPNIAFLDGKYLCSAPLSVIAGTSLDALAHLMESCLSAKADVYSMAAAMAGLKQWAETKSVLNGSKQPDETDLAALMRSAAFAGMAIAQTGTSLPHALSYILTYDLKVPHGEAVCQFLPAFLEAAPEAQRSLLLETAGFSSSGDFRAFLNEVFSERRIPEETLRRAYDTVASNSTRMASASFPVDGEILHRIVFG